MSQCSVVATTSSEFGLRETLDRIQQIAAGAGLKPVERCHDVEYRPNYQDLEAEYGRIVLVDGPLRLVPILMIFTLSEGGGPLSQEVQLYLSNIIPRFTCRGAIFHVVLSLDGVPPPRDTRLPPGGILITQYVRAIDLTAVQVLYEGFNAIGGMFRVRMDSMVRGAPSTYVLSADVLVVGDEPTDLLRDAGVHDGIREGVNIQPCYLSIFECVEIRTHPRRLVVIFVIDDARYTEGGFRKSRLFASIDRARTSSVTTGFIHMGHAALNRTVRVRLLFPGHALTRVGWPPRPGVGDDILMMIYRLIYSY
jgi:hypothetical protein